MSALTIVDSFYTKQTTGNDTWRDCTGLVMGLYLMKASHVCFENLHENEESIKCARILENALRFSRMCS